MTTQEPKAAKLDLILPDAMLTDERELARLRAIVLEAHASNRRIKNRFKSMRQRVKRRNVQRDALRAKIAELRAVVDNLREERERMDAAFDHLLNDHDKDEAGQIADGTMEVCAHCGDARPVADMHEPYDGADCGRCCTRCRDREGLWPSDAAEAAKEKP